MKTNNNTLYYNDYAGELKAPVRSRIEKARAEGKDLLIVADTSAGKTTLANDLMADFAEDENRSALVAPLQAIVNSKEGSHNDIDFGFGQYFLMGVDMSDKSFFTVYNTLADSALLNQIDYLFVDEPQTLIAQANIRGRINGKLIDSNNTKIYLTGTPLMLPEALGCDVLYLDRKEQTTNKRIVKYYDCIGTDEEMLNEITKHDKGLCTKVIRVNSKKSIQAFAGHLKGLGKSVVTYYSFDSKEAYLVENEDYLINNDFDELRSGIFNDVDYVLCTSALDSGVDMVCDRTIEMYCIGRQDWDREGVRLMVHPLDIKQFSARPRTQEVVNVNAIGRFDGSTEITSDYYDGWDSVFSDMRERSIDSMDYLRECSRQYSRAEYNTEESWVEMLEAHGLQTKRKGSLETIQGIKIQLRSNMTVLKHLYLSRGFNLIQQHETYYIDFNGESVRIDYELGVDLGSIVDKSSDMVIKSSDSVQFEEVASYIIDASILGINIALFINSREFKVNQLKDVIDCTKYLTKDTQLGKVIRKAIDKGYISKNELYLLETSEATITTFLKKYFKINRKAFSQEDIKNISIKGIKNTATPPPIPLIKYIAANKPEWAERVIDKVKYVGKSEKFKNEEREIAAMEKANNEIFSQLTLI